MVQDELADLTAELLVHRGEAPFFEIVQSGEVDDAVDRQRAIGEQALFPIGDLLAQPREQPVVVEKSQVRPFAFVSLLVARPVVMVERPQRGEMQQWKFDDLDAVLNIGPQRIILPIPDVLHQQDIAAFQLGSTGLVQVLLQRDKMIFHMQAVVELAGACQCFVNRLGLAVADDQNSHSLW